MDWAMIAAAVQAVVNAAAQYGIPIAQATAGPLEKQLRKETKADQIRLSGGGGGMSAGRAQEALAQQMGQAQMGYNQQMAQVGRGAATAGGMSGAQQQLANAAGAAYQQAGQQAASTVRTADLQEAASQRARNDQMALTLIGQANARKAALAQGFPRQDMNGQLAGMLNRGQTAAGMEKFNTKDLAGAAGKAAGAM